MPGDVWGRKRKTRTWNKELIRDIFPRKINLVERKDLQTKLKLVYMELTLLN